MLTLCKGTRYHSGHSRPHRIKSGSAWWARPFGYEMSLWRLMLLGHYWILKTTMPLWMFSSAESRLWLIHIITTMFETLLRGLSCENLPVGVYRTKAIPLGHFSYIDAELRLKTPSHIHDILQILSNKPPRNPLCSDLKVRLLIMHFHSSNE